MAAYDYLDQSLYSSIIILPFNNETFFHPGLGLTGFSFDGTHYTNGVQDPGPLFASWYSEAPGPYRSASKPFPSQAVVILSQVSMVIMDATKEIFIGTRATLPFWMQFLISDNFMLGNNIEDQFIGFTPQKLTYSNGVISVIGTPDSGSYIQSNVVFTVDFINDVGYCYLAVIPPPIVPTSPTDDNILVSRNIITSAVGTISTSIPIVIDASENIIISSAGTASVSIPILPMSLFVFVQTVAFLPTGVSDNVNGSYTMLSTYASNGNSDNPALDTIFYSWWYKTNCVAGAMTTITVDSVFAATSPPSDNTGIIVYSLTNVSPSAVVDSQSGTGSTTALSTPNINAVSGGILLAGWGDGDLAVTPYITSSGSWVTSANENCFYTPAGVQHQFISVSGPYSVTATATTSSPTWGGVSLSLNPILGTNIGLDQAANSGSTSATSIIITPSIIPD
jgi:hypothetical protein